MFWRVLLFVFFRGRVRTNINPFLSIHVYIYIYISMPVHRYLKMFLPSFTISIYFSYSVFLYIYLWFIDTSHSTASYLQTIPIHLYYSVHIYQSVVYNFSCQSRNISLCAFIYFFIFYSTLPWCLQPITITVSKKIPLFHAQKRFYDTDYSPKTGYERERDLNLLRKSYSTYETPL